MSSILAAASQWAANNVFLPPLVGFNLEPRPAAPDAEDCSICSDRLYPDGDGADGQPPQIPQDVVGHGRTANHAGHRFHANCLIRSLQEKIECPLCRAGVNLEVIKPILEARGFEVQSPSLKQRVIQQLSQCARKIGTQFVFAAKIAVAALPLIFFAINIGLSFLNPSLISFAVTNFQIPFANGVLPAVLIGISNAHLALFLARQIRLRERAQIIARSVLILSVVLTQGIIFKMLAERLSHQFLAFSLSPSQLPEALELGKHFSFFKISAYLAQGASSEIVSAVCKAAFFLLGFVPILGSATGSCITFELETRSFRLGHA